MMVFVHSDINGKNATVTVETEVENKNLNPTNAVVYSIITDRNGKQIAKTSEQKVTLSVNEKPL
jgi:beta-galactosidase